MRYILQSSKKTHEATLGYYHRYFKLNANIQSQMRVNDKMSKLNVAEEFAAGIAGIGAASAQNAGRLFSAGEHQSRAAWMGRPLYAGTRARERARRRSCDHIIMIARPV